MSKKVVGVLCVVAALVAICAPVCAQEKPPMYSYVANWAFPRAQWADVDKSRAALTPMMQKAVASGQLIAFGDDSVIIHQGDGETHDNWFSSNSMAGLMAVLDQLNAAGASASPTNSAATKHWDNLFVARYYNYKPGTYKGWGRGSVYPLKKDAPMGAEDQISKMLVPVMEKLLADGTIAEYEIDGEYVHTMDPGMIMLYYVCPTAEGLDKAAAATRAWRQEHKADMVMFDNLVDMTQHRDFLLRANATFK